MLTRRDFFQAVAGVCAVAKFAPAPITSALPVAPVASDGWGTTSGFKAGDIFMISGVYVENKWPRELQEFVVPADA